MRHAGFGGLVAYAAKVARVAGVIVDGVITDIGEIRQHGVPVWCRGLSAITSKRIGLAGTFCMPISCGGVAVRAGDVIIADECGVVVMDPADAEAAADRAIAMQEAEAKSRSAPGRRREASRHLGRDENAGRGDGQTVWKAVKEPAALSPRLKTLGDRASSHGYFSVRGAAAFRATSTPGNGLHRQDHGRQILRPVTEALRFDITLLREAREKHAYPDRLGRCSHAFEILYHHRQRRSRNVVAGRKWFGHDALERVAACRARMKHLVELRRIEPKARAENHASAISTCSVPVMRLLQSLAASPLPTPPRWNTWRPTASNTGRAREKSPALPPAMIESVAAAAPPGPSAHGCVEEADTALAETGADALRRRGVDGREVDAQHAARSGALRPTVTQKDVERSARRYAT
jgi:hypothetical protein